MAYCAVPHRTKHLESTQSTDWTSSSSTVSDQPSKTDKMDRAEKHDKTREKNDPRQWAYISDTVVRLTTLDEVLKSKAYLCLYERIS